MSSEISYQEFSKTVFGKQDRLALWGLVRQHRIKPKPEPFVAIGLARQLEVPPLTVYRELDTLEALEAVEFVPNSVGLYVPNQYKYPASQPELKTYIRINSDFWRAAGAFIDYANRNHPED